MCMDKECPGEKFSYPCNIEKCHNRNTLYNYNTDIIPNFNNVVVHCEWDDWVIGECNKECGGGMRTNTRTEKVSAEHGGEECPGPASVDESCNVHECPGYIMLHRMANYH